MSRPETRHIPVIFLSGMTRDEDHAAGAFSGGDAYLDKPCDVGDLLSTVGRLAGYLS